MTVSDVWGDWSTTSASNTPLGSATPEIDDELRNMKAQIIGNAVALSGNQTIAGIKTFSSFPVTPSTAPSSDYQVANKTYVDGNFMDLSSAQTAAGVKTFTSFPEGPSTAPTTDYQLANKKYVNDEVGAIVTDGLLHSYYMRYTDQKSQNTGGGDSVSSTLTTRVLNTEEVDIAGIGSIASNKITLPAGTYYIHASSPFVNVSHCRICLYNEDTAEIIKWGFNNYAANGYNGSARADMRGYFTLTGETDLSIKYFCHYASTNGLGFPSNIAGQVEVYTVVELWKVA
jgi:hypothetical protein